MSHIPVLLHEVVQTLDIKEGGLYVDGTFGAGGYTEEILKTPSTRVIAIDQDETAIANGQKLIQKYDGRLTLIHGCFGSMDTLIGEKVDGVALDIGVSSMQIDQAARGFSFQKDGPLDMRMGQTGQTAADVVNRVPEKMLADIIYQLGEERFSRKIAHHLMEKRIEKPFKTTLELATAVHEVVRSKPGEIDSATRTFQALRIYVNDELGELERGIRTAAGLLKPNGILAIVSFHSLEDRLVKQSFNKLTGNVPNPNKYLPPVERAQTHFKLLTKKPIVPTDAEIKSNPRSRSSKLRAIQKEAA